jgi:hypothetical protein
MNVSELMIEWYGRIPALVDDAVGGLAPEQLVWLPNPGANTIGWLVWHLARVQDDHVAELLHAEQLWATGDWAPRFGLEPDPSNTGYGHSADDVMTVRPESSAVLVEYLAAAQARTIGMLSELTESELDKIVDRNWDPPVTLGVRLVSVGDDCLQHAGQAAYLRGLLPAD